MAAKFVRVYTLTEEEDFGWSKEELKQSIERPVKKGVVTALRFIIEGFLPELPARKKTSKSISPLSEKIDLNM